MISLFVTSGKNISGYYTYVISFDNQPYFLVDDDINNIFKSALGPIEEWYKAEGTYKDPDREIYDLVHVFKNKEDISNYKEVLPEYFI